MNEQLDFLFQGLIGKNTYLPTELGAPARVHHGEHYAVVNSSWKTDTFNLIISKQLGEAAPKVVERWCSEFNDAKLPAAWWTCDELRDEPVAPLLRRLHFVEDEVDVGMIADLDTLPALDYPAGLELKQVTTEEEVVAFGRLIASLFDPPDVFVTSFYERVARLGRWEERPLKLFLGSVDGRPVATSSIYLDGKGGAHIFDISTLAEVRHRGFGSAITHFSLAFAHGLGARRGALQAAPDGVNIYRRIGFRELCTFRIYSNKQAIFSQLPR
ncbi:GNAT family N-acetyltransferase [Melittangium boletus]|uniref:Acetyltransferase n=1 Tax=Melittangium boletus DSM 14713 TaxID=1294270 RepID=A0A286NUR1_9BACT|nr:GNAT family N-acetyltransferase [Melittangium boletus]ATB26718.1 acetyltransferase [Melittangium boletus DSM 14713]